MSERTRRRRPVPSVGLLAGTVVATAGYLLPWFKPDADRGWWYSGLEYATASGGGGWTLWTFVFLALALIAAIWAGGNEVAASISLIATVAAAVFATFVVAVSLADRPDSPFLSDIAGMPFGVGLPILAVGLGISLVAGCYAIASLLITHLESRLRR